METVGGRTISGNMLTFYLTLLGILLYVAFVVPIFWASAEIFVEEPIGDVVLIMLPMMPWLVLYLVLTCGSICLLTMGRQSVRAYRLLGCPAHAELMQLRKTTLGRPAKNASLAEANSPTDVEHEALSEADRSYAYNYLVSCAALTSPYIRAALVIFISLFILSKASHAGLLGNLLSQMPEYSSSFAGLVVFALVFGGIVELV